MLKGHLSRVPWPGNFWMPFTFQPALWAFQQPHRRLRSLQLATHTQLAHHYIQYALSTLSGFYFLKSKRISSKYCAATSKHRMTLGRDARPIKVTHPPCLFRLPVCKWCHLINYSQERLCNFTDATLSTLEKTWLMCMWPLTSPLTAMFWSQKWGLAANAGSACHQTLRQVVRQAWVVLSSEEYGMEIVHDPVHGPSIVQVSQWPSRGCLERLFSFSDALLLTVWLCSMFLLWVNIISVLPVILIIMNSCLAHSVFVVMPILNKIAWNWFLTTFLCKIYAGAHIHSSSSSRGMRCSSRNGFSNKRYF